MKFSEIFTSQDSAKLNRDILITLRWIALSGQILTILVVKFLFNFKIEILLSLLIIGFGVLSNIYLKYKISDKQLDNKTSTIFLLYDILQLGTLLFLTGGITNPFTILLIIPAIVASTFLTLRSTINLCIVTIIMLIIISIDYYPLPHTGDLHFHVPDYYLYAIPTSVIVGLIFLTYFGARFGAESRKRTEALNKLELILAKEHELESIGERAAAAAHSLGTPLSTIAVIARELKNDLGNNLKYSKDINLLLSQTKRCSEILKNISQDKLEEDNFLSNVQLSDLLTGIVRSFGEISQKKILLTVKKDNNVKVKRTLEITYGLRNFIGNAVKYSNSFVEIILECDEKITELNICDDGPGFSEDIFKDLGEPYIRSQNKMINAKSGLGLGTFIGKTLLERMKGKVKFSKCSKTNGALVNIKWNTKDLVSI